jgi:glutamine amidotransferase
MTTVVVLDSGSGNIRSAEHAVARAGAEVTVTTDAELAAAADGLVVPGVGAFAACMAGLVAVAGPDIIAARLAAGRPTLAICVGHQVLFDAGIEHGVRAYGCRVWPGPERQFSM